MKKKVWMLASLLSFSFSFVPRAWREAAGPSANGVKQDSCFTPIRWGWYILLNDQLLSLLSPVIWMSIVGKLVREKIQMLRFDPLEEEGKKRDRVYSPVLKWNSCSLEERERRRIGADFYLPSGKNSFLIVELSKLIHLDLWSQCPELLNEMSITHQTLSTSPFSSIILLPVSLAHVHVFGIFTRQWMFDVVCVGSLSFLPSPIPLFVILNRSLHPKFVWSNPLDQSSPLSGVITNPSLCSSLLVVDRVTV